MIHRIADHSRLAWLALYGVLVVVGAASSGCGGGETRPTAPPRDPTIVLDTPENTARSLLSLLRNQLQAVADHDRAAAQQARDQVAWHVAAREEILRRHRTMAGAGRRDPATVLETLVESWAAAIEFYAGGLELEAMGVERSGPGEVSALVRMPVNGDGSPAELRLRCLKDRQTQEWRVVRLDLVPPGEAGDSVTVTRPAATTQSAPATGPASPATSAAESRPR